MSLLAYYRSVTALLGSDVLSPPGVIAVTVAVYSVPESNPSTTANVECRPESVIAIRPRNSTFFPPGCAVMRYAITGRPPSWAGGEKCTTSLPSLPYTAPTLGASGGDAGEAVGVTANDGIDGGLVPTELLAVTLKVHADPLLRFGTVTYAAESKSFALIVADCPVLAVTV